MNKNEPGGSFFWRGKSPPCAVPPSPTGKPFATCALYRNQYFLSLFPSGLRGHSAPPSAGVRTIIEGRLLCESVAASPADPRNAPGAREESDFGGQTQILAHSSIMVVVIEPGISRSFSKCVFRVNQRSFSENQRFIFLGFREVSSSSPPLDGGGWMEASLEINLSCTCSHTSRNKFALMLRTHRSALR